MSNSNCITNYYAPQTISDIRFQSIFIWFVEGENIETNRFWGDGAALVRTPWRREVESVTGASGGVERAVRAAWPGAARRCRLQRAVLSPC